MQPNLSDDDDAGEGNPLLVRRSEGGGAAGSWFKQEQFAGIASESDDEPVCLHRC